jgi:hypothetical protein
LHQKFEEMLMRSLVGGHSALPLNREKIHFVHLHPRQLVPHGLRKRNHRRFAGDRSLIGC